MASTPSAASFFRCLAHAVEIERGDDLAVAVDALGDLQAAAAGDQGFGVLQEQVVNIVALLGAHFDDVAKSGGCDQAELRAAALDQRVGDQGGAVHDLADIRKLQAGRGDDLGQALQRADGRVLRGGEAFVQSDIRALGIEQNEVGEGAADVEADAIARGHVEAPKKGRQGQGAALDPQRAGGPLIPSVPGAAPLAFLTCVPGAPIARACA